MTIPHLAASLGVAPLDRLQLEPVVWPTRPAGGAPRPTAPTPWAGRSGARAEPAASPVALPPRAPRPEPVFDEGDLARAAAAAAATARAELASDRHQRELALLATLSERIDALAAESRSRDEAARAWLLELGLALAKVLGAGPVDPAALERTVVAMLGEAEAAGRVRVEVHPSLIAGLEARLAGREIVLVGVAELAAGDVRVAWSDGWVERRRGDLQAAIEAALRAWAASGAADPVNLELTLSREEDVHDDRS